MVDDILNGWKNYLLPTNKTTEEMARKRAEICSSCPSAKHGLHTAVLPDYKIKEIQGKYCGECGCPLSTAVRSENYECALKKW